MEKEEKQILILVAVILLVALIITGLIFFAISVSRQKQARIEGYEKCKEDLEVEWQQARLMMQKAQDKEIELNDTLNALGSCNNDLSSCRVNLSECQKIVTKPNVYYLFGNTFEYSYEKITIIILGIFLIIPISFGISLVKFVFKIEVNWFAFFLGVLFALLIIFIIIIVGMGVE